MKKVDGREIIEKTEEIVTATMKENAKLQIENRRIEQLERKLSMVGIVF